jgi:hypothetical protein
VTTLLAKKSPKLATRIQKSCHRFKNPKYLNQSSFESSKELGQVPSSVENVYIEIHILQA